MLLATIDHTSSPNDADLNQPYDEAAEYELPQLIDRYFKRLFERFGLGPQQQRAYGTAQYLPAFDTNISKGYTWTLQSMFAKNNYQSMNGSVLR
ncbi:hypothetical protein H9L39_16912 [Fusarium oxysporum f. sp. albedinis]|nr:hypothetical protein H9L39_16912 [Fusarium oxysporum f. sp. albedinis]